MDDERANNGSARGTRDRFLTWPSPYAELAPAAAWPLFSAPSDEPPSAHASFDDAPASAPEPEPEPDPGVRAIPERSVRTAREHGRVLQSRGSRYAVHRTFEGVFLVVRTEDLDGAVSAIRRYEDENRDWPPRPPPDRARHPSSLAPVVMFAALALFLLVTGPVGHGSRWFQRGVAISDLVLSSEPWRAVTALTLHADSTHVMGNVISGSIFASAVQRRIGAGAAALTVLASGIAGNAANALFHHAMGEGAHGSLGASTAVFGAVGVLAALQLAIDRRRSGKASRSIVDVLAPLVGGLALLGALGASPEADLGAHLFGFLAGVLLGLVAALALRGHERRATRPWIQVALGAVALGVVVGSWELAMMRG